MLKETQDHAHRGCPSCEWERRASRALPDVPCRATTSLSVFWFESPAGECEDRRATGSSDGDTRGVSLRRASCRCKRNGDPGTPLRSRGDP